MSLDQLARYGPWALVTGAGAGFGAAYADALAAAGLSIVVVDLDGDAAAAEAARLSDVHGVETRVSTCDLSDLDAVETMLAATTDDLDRDLGLLVANAAASYVGTFADRTLETLEREVDVNVRATLRMVHRLLPRFRGRDRSGIVLMSSLSSRRGAALVANYAATKAYLATLGESLWDELRGDGVDVLAVLPGSTRTPGWLSSDPQEGLGTATVMDPPDVVAEVLDVLGSQPSLVPGAANRDNEAFMASLDRRDAVEMVGQVMRDMYPRPTAPPR